MSEKIIELTEEDLASVTGGKTGALQSFQGTSIGLVISALYEKLIAYSGDQAKRARLSSLVLEIAGYLQFCNYEMVKNTMSFLKIEYFEIYFDIVVICKSEEFTQIIPDEDK